MNVFDLFARLVLDSKEYEESLGDAEKQAEKVGEKIGNGLSTISKVGTAALAAGATAVGALGKQAIEAYADFEQLEGGVETLFGRSAEAVMKNADKAFQTAGLSANQYMETVTSFSASLIQSTSQVVDQDVKAKLDAAYAELDKLEKTTDKKNKAKINEKKKALKEEIKVMEESLYKTEKTSASIQKAAELADMAIIDMSDNANKMGTDMSMIQSAYNGFAKQNYTMLDNLKLGYGGTKEEMERLLADAQKISHVEYDISSYADIVEAIHVIQTEMGITGTTAKEAGTTISGSIGMMKAAWSDLTIEIAKPNGNIGQAIDNLVTTIVGDGTSANKGVIGNIMPAIENAFEGVGTLIEKLSPVIADKLPGIIDTLLPPLISAAGQLVKAVIENAPQLLGVLIDAIMGNPEVLLLLAPKLVKFLVKGFSSGAVSSLLAGAGKNLTTQLGAGITSGGATLTSVMGTVLTGLVGSIAAFFGGAEIGKKMGEWIFPSDEELYEHYKGITGTIEMIKDAAIGVDDLIHLDDDGIDYSKFTEKVFETQAIRQYRTQIDELTKAYEQGQMSADAYTFNVQNLIESSDVWAQTALDTSGKIAQAGEEARDHWSSQTVDELAEHYVMMAHTVTPAIQQVTDETNNLGNATSQTIQDTADKWTTLGTAEDRWGGTMDIIRQSTQTLSDTTAQASSDAMELSTSIDGTSESVDNLSEKVQLSADLVASMLEQLKSQITDADWVEILSPIKTGFDEFWVTMQDRLTEAWSSIKDSFDYDEAVTWGEDLVDNFISGVEAKFDDLESCMSSLAGLVKDYVGFSEPKKGPLSNFHTYAPDMMDLFAQGIRDNKNMVVDEFNGIELNPSVKDGVLNLGSGISNLTSDQTRQSSNTTVILELDKVELGKAVYNLNNEENQRMGVRLAGGVL